MKEGGSGKEGRRRKIEKWKGKQVKGEKIKLFQCTENTTFNKETPKYL